MACVAASHSARKSNYCNYIVHSKILHLFAFIRNFFWAATLGAIMYAPVYYSLNHKNYFSETLINSPGIWVNEFSCNLFLRCHCYHCWCYGKRCLSICTMQYTTWYVFRANDVVVHLCNVDIPYVSCNLLLMCLVNQKIVYFHFAHHHFCSVLCIFVLCNKEFPKVKNSNYTQTIVSLFVNPGSNCRVGNEYKVSQNASFQFSCKKVPFLLRY